MAKYEPRSSFSFVPGERPPNETENQVLTFLEAGLATTLKTLHDAAKAHRYVTVSVCQVQAQTLKNTIDAIRAGLHDADHPTRSIDPVREAEVLFARY